MKKSQIAAFFAIYIISMFLLHWLGYRAIIRFFSIESFTIIYSLRLAMTILAASFLLSSALSFRFNNIFTRIFYIGSATWLGFFIFFLISSMLGWLAYFILHAFGSEIDVSVIGQLFTLLGLVVSFYGVWNADTPRITFLEIKLHNLPNHWIGRKIIWISDLHLGQVRNLSYAEKIAREIRFLDPDIVFIGGDLYDGVATDLHKLAKPFGNLGAPLGTYFITGNHEEFRDNKPFLKAVESVGIKTLVDMKVSVDGVDITGIDYKTGTKKIILEQLYKSFNLDKSKTNILLIHEPTGIKLASEAGYNLQLSGHTHRAQLYFFRPLTDMVYKGFDYGYKKYHHLQVYTSSGVGTWGPPLRLGTQSEIVFIKLAK
jgi:hypothetical protein